MFIFVKCLSIHLSMGLGLLCAVAVVIMLLGAWVCKYLFKILEKYLSVLLGAYPSLCFDNVGSCELHIGAGYALGQPQTAGQPWSVTAPRFGAQFLLQIPGSLSAYAVRAKLISRCGFVLEILECCVPVMHGIWQVFLMQYQAS